MFHLSLFLEFKSRWYIHILYCSLFGCRWLFLDLLPKSSVLFHSICILLGCEYILFAAANYSYFIGMLLEITLIYNRFLNSKWTFWSIVYTYQYLLHLRMFMHKLIIYLWCRGINYYVISWICFILYLVLINWRISWKRVVNHKLRVLFIFVCMSNFRQFLKSEFGNAGAPFICAVRLFTCVSTL